MTTEDRTWARVGRTGESLTAVGRDGDRATDFVRRHKAALAVAAALAAFLADPGPFLDGARDIARVAAEAAIGPIASIRDGAALGLVRQAGWVATTAAMTVVVAGLAHRGLRRHRRDGPMRRR